MRAWILLLLLVPGVVPAQRDRSSRSDSLYLAGRRSLTGGEYAEAIRALDHLSQLKPEGKRLADAQYWQAFALYQLGGRDNLEQAEGLLSAAVAGGGTHHPDARALLTRVQGRLGRARPREGNQPPCSERDAAVAAERLGGLATSDSAAARRMAEAVLRAPELCGELVRRTAVIILGKGADPGRFEVLRMAAANDASPYLRVDALQRLRPDTSQATLALMLRLASREEADLVTLAAASHLAFRRTTCQPRQ